MNNWLNLSTTDCSGVTETTDWGLPILNCAMVLQAFLSTIYTFWTDRDLWIDLTINLLRGSVVFYCGSSMFYVQNVLAIGSLGSSMDFYPFEAVLPAITTV
jgi:hypothetical protein